ncbi:MAG TPA: VOC family protein [Gammaproteobacteria bacterium]|nr:VOC family protein [Gammaproteobacteria bacterium]
MRPSNTLGLRHLALTVKQLEACVSFYSDVLGMRIEWKPDADNVYLSTGNDNLALHRASENFKKDKCQALDHLGFILKTPEEVDSWCEYLKSKKVIIRAEPKTHRDGARSFYCEDPDGNLVQMIFHKPLV